MADNIATTPGSGATIAADDVGGVLHQRVKVSVGADGAASDMAAPSADGTSSGVVLPAGGMILGTGGTWNRVQDASAVGDAGYGTGVGLPISNPRLYNGATFDRQRGNTEGTLLASAARTTTTSSATQTNYNARGVLVFLHVTVASGTGGLTVQIQGLANGFGYNLNASPTAVTATTLSVYEVSPGATGTSTNVPQRTSGSLPRSWAVSVVHGDASSYTYAVYYALIL